MTVLAYHKPTSLGEVWRLKAQNPEALYVAGGTDMMVRIRSGLDRPSVLISLQHVDELRGVELGQTVRIGALTTVSQILAHRILGEVCPVLIDAARPIGSVQIRNLATIGGNLCNASPCADLVPALLVLDARVCLAGPDGEREVRLEDLFQGAGETCLSPDEVLTSILFEPPPPGARATFLKKTRVRMDLALVSVAVLLEMDGSRCTRARVAAGSVAPRPIRLRSVEAAIEGQSIGASLMPQVRKLAEQAVSPITDVRTTAEYRRHMTGVLFQRAVGAILGGNNHGG